MVFWGSNIDCIGVAGARSPPAVVAKIEVALCRLIGG